ncbi:alpha-tocopherol transfer protein-like [Bombyx mandarina]|uniref:Alpha-tocopherol transfer protein-like n=1 Tax=Bombyx mandarina TaxID=7092 RepID=A0A6J2JX60_BOMMA|nr:alpha-tocopherol transfer protein-like [Bombyx mandarina]
MELQMDVNGNPYVVWGEHKIQLEREPVTGEALLEKAEKELRETPEIVEKAVADLRTLLKGEKNLFVPYENDDFLIRFLRPCKFYPESAFKRIKAYYKFKISYPEYCRDLLPSATRDVFKHSIMSALSPRDQNGCRILAVESGERWNPREVSLRDMFRVIQMGLVGAISEPRTQICGIVSILDMKGLSFSHVMQFTPSYAKMVLEWLQDCVPIRLKAVHIINQPYIFNMLFAIFKPFIREKLRGRIHLHGSNLASLREHIDPEALRKRHGGYLPEPEIDGEVLWKMMCFHEKDFELANSYGYTANNNNNK